jgi:hypothetical protein
MFASEPPALAERVHFRYQTGTHRRTIIKDHRWGQDADMNEEYDFSNGEHGKYAKRYAVAQGEPASSINEPILPLAPFKEEAGPQSNTEMDDETPISTPCETVSKPLASLTDKAVPIEQSKNE